MTYIYLSGLKMISRLGNVEIASPQGDYVCRRSTSTEPGTAPIIMNAVIRVSYPTSCSVGILDSQGTPV